MKKKELMEKTWKDYPAARKAGIDNNMLAMMETFARKYAVRVLLHTKEMMEKG